MPDIKSHIIAELRNLKAVRLTLINGKEVIGVVEAPDQDFLRLHMFNGREKAISYELIGMVDPLDESEIPLGAVDQISKEADVWEPVQEAVEKFASSDMDILQLKKVIEKQYPVIRSECAGAFDSLVNAIKIRETNVKFNRTPRIIRIFQKSLENHPENGYLALMIGKTAEIAGDPSLSQRVLTFLVDSWKKPFIETPGLLKELCDLCIDSKDSVPLISLAQFEKQENFAQLCVALFYLLRETEMKYKLPEDVTPFTPHSVDVLLTLLPYNRAEKMLSSASVPVFHAASVSVASSADKKPKESILKGEIRTYDSSARNGFIIGEDGKEYFFQGTAVLPIFGGKIYARQSVQFKKRSSVDMISGKVRDIVYEVQILNAGAVSYTGPSSALLQRANNLYTRGKENDDEALRLLEAVIARRECIAAVAPTYIAILCRNNKVEKAECFLLEHEREIQPREKYLQLLLNVHEKQNNLRKCLDVYTELLSVQSGSMKINTQLHYINRKAALLARLERPKEALEVWEQWLTLKKKNEVALRVQTRAFDTIEPKICVMAASQIKHVRKDELEFEPSKTILSFINIYPEAIQAMEEQEINTLDRDAMFDDSFESIRQFDTRITPFVDMLLKECNITQYLDVRVYDRMCLRYNGSISESIQEAKKLGSSSTQKPFERYQRNLTAARVIYDALKNNPFNGGESDSDEVRDDAETLFFDFIGKSLASGGDAAVINNAPLDVARYYYTEGLQYLPRDSQDAQNAVVRAITSFVSSRSEIPLAMNRNKDNLSISTHGAGAIAKVPAEKTEALLVEIVEMTRKWPELSKTISKIILNSTLRDRLVDVLCQSICNMQENEVCDNVATIQKAFEKARDILTERETRFAQGIALLSEFSYLPKWIDDFSKDLSWYSDFRRFMPAEDQSRIDQISDILRAARQYNDVTDFSLKEEALLGNYNTTIRLEKEICEMPSRYAYRYLYPILSVIIKNTKGELNAHYGENAPCVDLEIVGMDKLMVSDRGELNIQANVKNTGNCQVADNLTLVIEDVPEEYEVAYRDERCVAVKGNDGVTFQVVLRLKNPESRTFTLRYSIHYQYTKAVGDIFKEIVQRSLAVIINGGTFMGLENPYNEYVTAATVEREDMVFGRKQFIDDIVVTCIGSRSSPLRRKTIALFGQKRTGKSTVLYHLARRLKVKAPHSLVVNLGDISKWKAENFEKQMFRKFFEELRYDLEDRHPVLWQRLQNIGIKLPQRDEIADNDSGREWFGDFFTAFNRLIDGDEQFRDYNVIMLLDEFTNIYIRLCNNRENLRGPKMDDDFMQYWKAIVNDFRLVCIVVGQDFMKDFVNAYPNPFGAIDYRQVTYLSDDEARRMIVSPPIEDENRRVIFEGPSGERAIKRIIELTAGSAFFLMIFMDRLIKHLTERKQQYVTDADVERVMQGSLLSGSDSLDLPKFESLYNDDGDVTDPFRPRHNAAVLWAIAHCLHKLRRCTLQDIVIPSELDDNGALDQKRCRELANLLVERGVLSRIDGNYSIRVKLFDEWLYSNCSIDTINSIPDSSRKE